MIYRGHRFAAHSWIYVSNLKEAAAFNSIWYVILHRRAMAILTVNLQYTPGLMAEILCGPKLVAAYNEKAGTAFILNLILFFYFHVCLVGHLDRSP